MRHLVDSDYSAEYLAVLNMAKEYDTFREFVSQAKVDLAVFIPYDDKELGFHLPKNDKSHELNLLNHELLQEGYQSEIRLEKKFEEFQQKGLSKTHIQIHLHYPGSRLFLFDSACSCVL